MKVTNFTYEESAVIAETGKKLAQQAGNFDAVVDIINILIEDEQDVFKAAIDAGD